MLALFFTLSFFCESTFLKPIWVYDLVAESAWLQGLREASEPRVIILQWCIFTYVLHCRDGAYQSGPGRHNGGGKLEERVESGWMFKFALWNRYGLGKGICLDHKPKINWTPGCKIMQKQMIWSNNLFQNQNRRARNCVIW